MIDTLARLHARILNLLGRGRVQLVDDTGPVQKLQLDLGPQGKNGPLFVLDGAPVLGLFGLASSPPIGADVMMAYLGGDHQRAAAIGHNHQPSRLRGLSPGDAALYDVRGAFVKLTAAGLVIDAAGLNVVVQNADDVTVTAVSTVTVNGPNVTVNASVAANVYAPAVNLGGAGGAAVARVGDSVNLSTGKIVSGSSVVKST